MRDLGKNPCSYICVTLNAKWAESKYKIIFLYRSNYELQSAYLYVQIFNMCGWVGI